MCFPCLVSGLQAGKDGNGWEEVDQCLQELLLGGELAQYPSLEANLKQVEVISEKNVSTWLSTG